MVQMVLLRLKAILSEGTVEKDLKAGDVTVNKDNKGTVNGLSIRHGLVDRLCERSSSNRRQKSTVDTRVMAVEDIR